MCVYADPIEFVKKTMATHNYDIEIESVDDCYKIKLDDFH